MSFVTKEKIFSLEWFKVYTLILLGTFIMSAGFVFFISPYKLAPGGVYGVAIVLHHLFNLPIGVLGISMDIPLTLLGLYVLGPKFGVKTVVGFISTSLWITLLEYTWGYEPLVADEALLSSIFGGLLIGFGLGLVFKSRATSGGTDIIAMIIGKYTKLPVGQLLMIVDSVVVLIGLVAFKDWKIPLYSWIVIFITGKVIDIVLDGIHYEKSLFIISEKHELIRDKIINDLERGGTYVNGVGMFSNETRPIIWTTINRREFAILKDYIRKVDPKAFVTAIDAKEIFGEGFKNLSEAEV